MFDTRFASQAKSVDTAGFLSAWLFFYTVSQNNVVVQRGFQEMARNIR